MIPLKEYSKRRSQVLKALKGAVGIVIAGDSDGELSTSWRAHAHFEYLTGIANEPGAMLLLDPKNPTKSRQSVLFLQARDPELEQWDGLRKPLGSSLRESTGLTTIMRTRSLAPVLEDVASRNTQFATLMPHANIDQPVSKDVELWNKVLARSGQGELIDKSWVIPKLRSVKSSAEIKTIQEAVNMTAKGFADAFLFLEEGVNEYQVQATLEHGYAMAGGRGSAFPSIVGGGINSTVLHYKENINDLVDGDVVCIDSGAFHAGYGADISRTVPVSGKFTKRQKEVYEIVLKAQESAIKAVKPGVTLGELDAVARAVIVKAGYGDNFIHSIGHHLGLETHDRCGPMAPLEAGAVITIEPGIYLPDEAIGIRIEDDIVVTAKGHKNLSKNIPKSVVAIEKAMRRK
jgi:Xaa-Pro aminopeptidase